MIIVDSRINRVKCVIIKQDNRLIDELMKINIYFHGDEDIGQWLIIKIVKVFFSLKNLEERNR